MKRILLADDEIEFVNALKSMLERHDYEVLTASNGAEALEVVANVSNKINLFIFDIVMPQMDGLSLIDELKKKYESLAPIIVIGSEINKANMNRITQFGVVSVLQKPFNLNDLLKVMEVAFKGDNKPFQDSLSNVADSEFLKINLDEFISNPVCKYDMFIKFSDAKYLKVLKKGDELTPDRMAAYRKKLVTHLFIRKSDHKSYLKDSIQWLTEESTESHREERIKAVKRMNELVLEEIYSENLDQEIFQSSLEVSNQFVDLALKSEELFKLLKDVEGISDDLYRHSAAVNIFSVMMSKKVGWISDTSLLKLTVASLYHDVGKKWLSPDILKKSESEYTQDDWNQYKKHPEFSGQILSELPNVPGDLLEIVMHHHENYCGNGYPNALNRTRIHPLAKLMSIVNDYCNLTLKRGKNSIYPHTQALDIMKKNVDCYDPQLFKVFLQIFKVS